MPMNLVNRVHLYYLFFLWLLVVGSCPAYAKNDYKRPSMPVISRIELLSRQVLGPICCIAQGPLGFIWLGTAQGLVRFDGYKTELYRHQTNNPSSLSDNLVIGVVADKAQNIWVATATGGLNRYIPQSGGFEHFGHVAVDINSLSSNRLTSLSIDPQGLLWLNSDKGINRFDPASKINRRFLLPPTTQQTTEHNQQPVVDNLGDIWMLSRHRDLYRYRPKTGQFKHFLTTQLNQQINAVYSDLAGIIWLGTTAGVYQLNPTTGQSKRLDGTDKGEISAIIQDRQGFLWFASIGLGLMRYDPARNKRQNIGPGDTQAIFLDHHQHLWLATKDGVMKFDASHWFGRQRFMVGGIFRGLDSLLRRQTVSAKVVITGFKLFNQSLSLNSNANSKPLTLKQTIEYTSNITLGSEQSLFSFLFALPGHDAPQLLEYAYQMQGFDQKWITTGAAERQATYTGLPPGDYTFKVKARHQQHNWSENTDLSVKILPSVWASPTAYLWYILLLALALGLFGYRLRYQRQPRQHQVICSMMLEATASDGNILEPEPEPEPELAPMPEFEPKPKLELSLQQRFRDKVNQTLQYNYKDASYNVGSLAIDMALSRRQLSRKMMDQVQMTPVEYIRLYRLSKAAELLQAGALPSKVSFEVGFMSHSHFGRCFKQQYHMLPSQYYDAVANDKA